ncbi:uncharacterized protein [Euwallacea fornicatus]|uniref:uncharacterized protein n=1 Tax=Euwallacea fornicatus TaxID=995702 RepID=UPI003390330B
MLRQLINIPTMCSSKTFKVLLREYDLNLPLKHTTTYSENIIIYAVERLCEFAKYRDYTLFHKGQNATRTVRRLTSHQMRFYTVIHKPMDTVHVQLEAPKLGIFS